MKASMACGVLDMYMIARKWGNIWTVLWDTMGWPGKLMYDGAQELVIRMLLHGYSQFRLVVAPNPNPINKHCFNRYWGSYTHHGNDLWVLVRPSARVPD